MDTATILEPHSIAREAARRRDAQLVRLIAQALEPYPIRVIVTEDRPGELLIRLGRPDGVTLAVPVDASLVTRYGPDELAVYIGLEARRRWHDLEPLPVPDNVILGQE